MDCVGSKLNFFFDRSETFYTRQMKVNFLKVCVRARFWTPKFWWNPVFIRLPGYPIRLPGF